MAVYVFPGQGSQKVGMGEGLFEKYPDLTSKADEILGYSISELCLKDPQSQLGQTQFTQPALYVVDVLTYHQKLEESGGSKPKYTAGHSLGEYAALYAGGCFDFETGLKLVKKRAALMGEVSGGGMAAIIGKSPEEVESILKNNQLDTIDVANYNSIKQVVLSGLKADVENARPAFEAAGAMYFPLNVSGAFHSRYMTPSRDEFQTFVEQFDLKVPEIPVIANYTARPYSEGKIKENLIEQINHSVKWCDSVKFMLEQGEEDFVEVGPGNVLIGLIAKIKRGQ